MRKLNHYISLTLLRTIFIVCLFFIGLAIFLALVNESRDIGKGEYDLFAAVRYVMLSIPNQLYQLFPSAGLLGSLLGLGLLAHHGELIGMRACGVSTAQLSKIVLRIAIILTIFVTLLAEWINPQALHLAQTEKTLAKSSGQALATAHGLWIRDQDYFIHIKTVSTPKQLESVSIYQLDADFRLKSATFAQSAHYHNGVWQLQQVARSIITPQRVYVSHLPTEILHVSLDPTILKVATVEPEEMSLFKLYLYIKYLEKNKLSNESYEYVFWSRVMQPLVTIVMTMLAIPFIFGPLRQVSLGLRIVAGVCIGFAFHLMHSFLGPFAVVYAIPPVLASIVPIVLGISLGVFFSRKI